MKIHLVRTGGFGGMRREIRIETESLSRGEEVHFVSPKPAALAALMEGISHTAKTHS